MRTSLCATLVSSWIAAVAAIATPPSPPTFTEGDLVRARGMLRRAQEEVVREFHDPQLLGANFNQQCDVVDQALPRARSNSEAMMMIAQAFLDLGDSHTAFISPRRRDLVKHGWQFHAVGPATYVSQVDKGSDAAAKGLRVGDRVLAIDGIEPRPADLNRLKYLLIALAPRSGMRVIVQAPGGAPRQLDLAAKVSRGGAIRDLTNTMTYHELVTEGENHHHQNRSLFASLPGDILVWRLRRFDEEKIAGGLLRVRGAKAVVLDLRGNPGGSVSACQDMLRGFFDQKFVALTEWGRGKKKEWVINGRGTFTGPLYVLIDRQSSSASEVFARNVQLRQRGVVLGERSAGALSVGQIIPLSLGSADKFTSFGVGVTVAKIVMSDGASVEGIGVTPEHVVIPSHEDLYQRRDPLLARVLALIGHELTPEAAGQLFPTID